MSRDTGRRSVYIAEDAAFIGTPLVTAPGVEVLAAALAALFESPWWRHQDVPVPSVAFRAGRNDGFVRHPAGATRAGGPIDLGLPGVAVRSAQIAPSSRAGCPSHAGPPNDTGHPSSDRRIALLSLGSEATWHVASHEVAHLVSRRDDKVHGPVFRGGHIAVAAAVFGADCAEALHTSYQRFGLDVTTFPSPTAGPGDPIWDSMIAWERAGGGWRAAERTTHSDGRHTCPTRHRGEAGP